MNVNVHGAVSKKRGEKSGITANARDVMARTAEARDKIAKLIAGVKKSKTGVVLGAKRKAVRRRNCLAK